MHAGGNPCTLTATASLDNSERDKLALQLQCGSITCRPTSPFRCENIHDELAIGKSIHKINELDIVTSIYSIQTAKPKLYEKEDLYPM